MCYLDFCKKCYELYKKSWCDQRGYSISNWNNKHGFNGESFASEEEFYSNEFIDGEIMSSILSSNEFIFWKEINKKGLYPQIYTVPVQWSVVSTVKIEATSWDEVLFIFEKNIDDSILPKQSNYVEGSFRLLSNDIHIALQGSQTIDKCKYEIELLKLEEIDDFFLSKLCIYRELRDIMKEENFSEKEVIDLVDILFEFYINAKIEDFTAVDTTQCCLDLLDDFGTLKQILNYQPIEFQSDNTSGLYDKLMNSYCNKF